MGQYYLACSIDSLESFSPYSFNSGAKLLEHSWAESEFVNAVCVALSPGGRWNKQRIVWAGDYMDEGLFIEGLVEGKDETTLYVFLNDKRVSFNYKDYCGPVYNVIINHTTKEYVCVYNCPEKEGWVIHPLPLLTASGNGRGSGDYRDESNLFVGTWAGHSISTDTDIPFSYTEIFPNFIEK